MIQDKDYIIRIVKQFSEFLSRLLLEKNEGELKEDQLSVFETNMNDTFKMDFETLSSKSISEIQEMLTAKNTAHELPYLELLGHLFYFKFKQTQNPDFSAKASYFYQQYLEKSGIFSMPIMSRIGELKQ